MTAQIQVELPTSLRLFAGIVGHGAIALPVEQPVTLAHTIHALELAYPALTHTLRDPATGRRRALVRFFACGEDISHQPLDAPVPAPVARGAEPLLILGAIAGG
jgi:hypothetical protein